MPRYTGHGIVWDAENNKILVEFDKDHQCDADARSAEILDSLGYACTDRSEKPLDQMTKAELVAAAVAAGIEIAATATKADIISALDATK